MASRGPGRLRSFACGLLALTLTVTTAAACTGSKSKPKSGSTAAVTITSVDIPTIVGSGGATASAVVSSSASAVSAEVGSDQIPFVRKDSHWTAALKPGSPLVTGVNSLYVKAKNSAHTSNPVERSVYVLGQATNLGLTLTDASADNGEIVSVSTTAAVDASTMTVNGKDVSSLLAPNATSQKVALGAGDGLVRGKNTIVVTDVQDNGNWQRATLIAQIDGAVPIAEAGPALQGRVDIATTLDASKSSPVKAGDAMKYSWTIASAPANSHASLTDPTSAHPQFLPDVAGQYQFRVAVTGPGGTTTDLIRLAVTPFTPPIGARLLSQAPGAGGTLDLQVNAATIASMPTAIPGASMLAIYDRQTLGLTANVSTTAAGGAAQAQSDEVSDINQANTSELNGGFIQGYLAVLSVNAGPAVTSQPAVSALGVTPDATMLSGAAFSIVALTGTGSGSNAGTTIGVPIVWRSSRASGAPGLSAGNISGYLQISNGGPTSYSPYQYVPDGNTAYDTAATSSSTTNTMTFGTCPGSDCQSLKSDALSSSCAHPGALGGFQLVALTAANLQYQAGVTVTTNDGCGAQSDLTADLAAITSMNSFLARYPVNVDGATDYLVAVQSIGSPRPVATETTGDWSSFTSAWLTMGTTLVGYGATTSVFDAVGGGAKQGYALLGTTSAKLPGSDSQFGKEVSSDNPSAPTARLAGLLGRNHRYDLVPQVNVDGAGLNTLFGTAIYQPATAWPESSTPGQQAALAYITKTTGPNLDLAQNIVVVPSSGGSCYDPTAPSFRDAYCNTGLNWSKISDLLLKLENTPPSDGVGFTATDWHDVVAELVTETSEIPNVSTMLSYVEKPFANADEGVNLNQIVTDINASLKAPNTAYHAYDTSTWLALVGDIAGIVWAAAGLAGEGVGQVVGFIAGVVSEVFAIAADFTDKNGKPAVAQPTVVSDAANLGNELQTRYVAASQNIAYLSQILVTDPVKLQLATTFVNTTGVTADAENATLVNLQNAAKSWLYSNLLATSFQPVSLWLPQPDNGKANPYWRPYQGDASTFLCDGQGPFKSVPTAAEQYQAMAPSQDPSAYQPIPVHYVLAAPGTALVKGNVSIAPDAVITTLEGNPSAAGGGLGMPASYLYERQLGLSPKSQQSCAPAGQNAIGGPATSGPLSAVAPTVGSQVVFARSQNNVLGFVYTQLSNSWQALPALPTAPDPGSPIAVGSEGPGDLHVFYMVKGKVVNAYTTLGQPWGGPGGLPASVVPDKGSAFAVTSPGQGKIDLFYVQKGRLVVESWLPGSGFTSQPTILPGKVDDKSQLAATYSPSGGEHVFFVSGGVITNDYTADANAWNGPGQLTGRPNKGTPLAGNAFTDAHWNVFFTLGDQINNIYVENNGPVGGPGLVTYANASGGIATAGTGNTVAPAVFWSSGDVLYETSWGSQGWAIGTIVSPVPPTS